MITNSEDESFYVLKGLTADEAYDLVKEVSVDVDKDAPHIEIIEAMEKTLNPILKKYGWNFYSLMMNRLEKLEKERDNGTK